MCPFPPFFHAVLTKDEAAGQQKLHTLTPGELRDTLRALAARTEVVPVDMYIRAALDDRRRLACVTFDDAYRSVFMHALPIIEELGIPATVFVNGAMLEGRTFWRDQVRLLMGQGLVSNFLDFLGTRAAGWELTEKNFYRRSKHPEVNCSEVAAAIHAFLAERGMAEEAPHALVVQDPTELPDHPLLTYGSHGYSHYVMSSLTDAEQEEEIVRNEEVLARLPGKPSRVFSVPFGEARDVNATTMRILKERGYLGALMVTHPGKGTPTPETLHGLPVAWRVKG